MIKNIVFDMGGVLVIDDIPRYIARFAQQGDIPLLQKELFEGPEWRAWDLGTVEAAQLTAAVCRRLPERLHAPCAAMVAQWHMNPEHMPGMEALIRRLAAGGYGIFLLSNTALSYYSYRQRLPAIDVFEGEFLSAECGLLKPDREIYDAFTAQFGLRAETCFFVDDKPENIAGALDAGWSGFVFGADATALERALQKAGVATA